VHNTMCTIVPEIPGNMCTIVPKGVLFFFFGSFTLVL
jgi:hypothetical protein